MKGYLAKVVRSSKELTKKEQILMKDTSDCVKLDEALNDGVIIEVKPDLWAELEIHNEKSENPDYMIYIFRDGATGTKYYTGSESFWTTFMDMMDEMSDSDEDYAIKIYKHDSKNYAGKQFITCSII